MQDILIFGTNDFAEILYEYIKQGHGATSFCVKGFVVDVAYYHEKTSYDGLPIYPYSQLTAQFRQDEIMILVAVGYTNMNLCRKEIFQRLQQDGWKIVSYIDKRAIVNTEDLGTGNIILDGANIGVCCHVGTGNVFYPESLLAHHCSLGNFNFLAISSSVAGYVQIGDRCFFGNNSCTKEKIRIADACLVGAGCYLPHDVEGKGAVFVPARGQQLLQLSSEQVL